MQNLEEYMLPCLNKKLFGFECMGCGLQRSASLILKGEFIEAFYMYPAIYSLILFFSFIILNHFKNFKHSSKIINTLGILTITIIIISFLIKKIN
jgi:hypothetical protein